MLESKENRVKVEGVLSEIDLKEGTMKKSNGAEVKTVGGVIKVKVNQLLKDGTELQLEVPVHMFAGEMTNKGTVNPAYTSIMKVMTEFQSIASVGEDAADRVRITGAKLTMNEYYNQNGQLVSFPRIQASFISKIGKSDCKPEATFSVIFAVGEKHFQLDKDGIENPNCYVIKGILPQYGGKIDIMEFHAVSKGVIDATEQYWPVGSTVKAYGRLNFSSRTEEKEIEADFGEATIQVRTISTSELVITGGSSTPMEGDFAFSDAEIKAALSERQARLQAEKDKAANKSAPVKNSAKAYDLGF